ncbi:hypothetical protein GW17_00012810 [Ensete ventricosum]|nr:hypothetical protein GW17_00012810 [Ensete ventricosum]
MFSRAPCMHSAAIFDKVHHRELTERQDFMCASWPAFVCITGARKASSPASGRRRCTVAEIVWCMQVDRPVTRVHAAPLRCLSYFEGSARRRK